MASTGPPKTYSPSARTGTRSDGSGGVGSARNTVRGRPSELLTRGDVCHVHADRAARRGRRARAGPAR